MRESPLDSTDLYDLRAGAKAGNIRHFNRQSVYATKKRCGLVLTRGDEVKTFATARTCSLSMKWNIHSVYHAINKRRPYKGWTISYANGKAGAA